MDNRQTRTLQPKTDYSTAASQSPQATEQSSTGGSSDKVDSGEKSSSGDNQSFLDKGISYLQESITGKSDNVERTGTQAPQGNTNHTAVDEAHPEKISEFLRDQNRSITKEEFK